MEGLNSNKEAVYSLIEKFTPNYICLQETWLFESQHQIASDLSAGYDAHSKSVELSVPAPSLPRGHGGVTTLWNKNLHQPLPLEDGSERVVVTKDGNIVVVNAYLPCRGSYTDMEFLEVLDEIHEICQKFEEDLLIVAADFNVDTTKHKGTRVSSFKSFLKVNKLAEITTINEPTFMHHNGKHSSKIDYILVNERLKNSITKVTYIKHDEPTSTSTHSPLILEFTYESVQPTQIKRSGKCKNIPKPIWSKCNLELYEKRVSESLNTAVDPVSPQTAVKYLTQSLTKAAKEAAPFTRHKPFKKPWNKSMAVLKRNCIDTHITWRESKATHDDDLITENALKKRSAQRKFRQAQRIQEAAERQNNLNRIFQADENDKALFYSIIKRQRQCLSTNTTELSVNNHIYMGNLLPAWEEHFTTLATPAQNDNFTHERFNRACQNVDNIRASCASSKSIISDVPITKHEVREAITALKKKKALDGLNLAAEHFQNAITPVVNFLTPVLNRIVDTAQLPEEMQINITHPVHKKGKQKNAAGNYRGITISPVVTKILDTILLAHQKTSVYRNTDDLQFGFTKARSGVHAAFILNESIAESTDNKMPLYIASLDVQKAFDVVRHESLLDKLHEKGLPRTWWKLKEASYQNLSTKITWEGELSQPIHMKQGNKQGGLPSPDDYITYLDKNLEILENSQMGFHIGNICLVSPTCADDMLLLASSMYEMQVLLNLIVTYANEEHYVIHPEKTVIIPVNIKSEDQLEYMIQCKPWEINNKRLTVTRELVHIGIQRELSSVTPAVQTRISNCRKTLNGLFGAGFYGKTGLPLKACLHLYKIYVLPRLLYGLEALILNKPNLAALEVFQRKVLRSLMGVPDRTAIAALYIITGILPIDAQLNKKHLMFLHSMISVEGRLKNLILRQYAVKKPKSKSWITNIKTVLLKYSLPSVLDLLHDCPPKASWKKIVKIAIINSVEKSIREEAECKSTLVYLNPCFKESICHNVAYYIQDPREVRRACIKTQMLTGTYPFQATRVVYKQAVTDTCLLCGEGKEDLVHCLLLCPRLYATRTHYLPAILNSILPVPANLSNAQIDPNTLTQLIMDNTHPGVAGYISLEDTDTFERITRNFCFALHTRRTCMLL